MRPYKNVVETQWNDNGITLESDGIRWNQMESHWKRIYSA